MQNTPEISKDCDASPGVQGARPRRDDFYDLLLALNACGPALDWLDSCPNLGLQELYDQCQDGCWLHWLVEEICHAMDEPPGDIVGALDDLVNDNSHYNLALANAFRASIPFARLEKLVARAIAMHKAGTLLTDDGTDDWDDEDEMSDFDVDLDDYDDDDWIDDWEDDEDDDWIDDEEEGEDGDDRT